MARKERTTSERFWRYVAVTEDCWLWTGAVYAKGYGAFSLVQDGRHCKRAAHRFSYEMVHGPIPADHVVHHLCHVRHCVRPDHLVVVTQAENVRAQMDWVGPATHGVRRPGDMPSWSARRTDRFWQFVQKGEGCWLWTGPRTNAGYGRFLLSQRGGVRLRVSSHRFAYELEYGPVPGGLVVAHRCDHRACVRPDHLFLATPAENSADMVAKGRQSSGHRNGGARLTDEHLHAITALAQDGLSDRQIGERLGISRGHVGRIVRGVLWPGAPIERPSAEVRLQQCRRSHVAGALRGEQCHTAKLTAADIPVIRRALDGKEMSTAALSRRYGVTEATIYAVGLRKTWRHVPE